SAPPTATDSGSCEACAGSSSTTCPPSPVTCPPSRCIHRASFCPGRRANSRTRSEEHTSELQSLAYLVCRRLLVKHTETRRSTSERNDGTPRGSQTLSALVY